MWQKKKGKKSERGTVSTEFAHIEVSLLKSNIRVFTLGEEYFPKKISAGIRHVRRKIILTMMPRDFHDPVVHIPGT